jgi:hypothetical protein
LYTDEPYELKAAHMDELVALEPMSIAPERLWLLAERVMRRWITAMPYATTLARGKR